MPMTETKATREERVRAKTQGSWRRYQRAQATLAGGVSSGLRRAARPYPLYFTHGAGARSYDVDGNAYWDYGLAWGPLIVIFCSLPVSLSLAVTVRMPLASISNVTST